MPKDLSVIITARNEEFLSRTVDNVLINREADTEVIVIFDGNWADPPIKDDKDVIIITHSESIGQRQAINEAIKLSTAKYIMKLDAHCLVEKGFDRVLCEAGDKLGKDVTQVPRMYNIHAFDWKCKKCGNRWYQSPIPSFCKNPGESRGRNRDCDGKDFERVIVWKIRKHKRTDFMRFNSDMRFKYWGSLGKRKESQPDIADTMSIVGACFFMNREKYWEVGGSEEEWGSWGQQGTEISCKTWLSSLKGRLVVNKKTWFGHLFRTQGGTFGFPYTQSVKQQNHAKKRSIEVFKENTWDKQVRPLSWLLDHFSPVPDWTEEEINKVRATEDRFVDISQSNFTGINNINNNEEKIMKNVPTKGILYFTDGRLDPKMLKACQKQLLKANLPIYSVTLYPMDFGKNAVLPMKRGWLTLYKQILIGLYLMTEDIVFPVDHDTIYHPSHWDFTPEKEDVYYYNLNEWRIRCSDGFALHYDAKSHHNLACYRKTLIKYYEKKVKLAEEAEKEMDDKGYNLFLRQMGCEPGTHNRVQRLDRLGSEIWRSEFPNLDLRHDKNNSANRWSKDQFRNKQSYKNWQEAWEVPFWGVTKGRVNEIINNILNEPMYVKKDN